MIWPLRMICLAAILLVAGCGVYHWRKDGADSTAFQRDSTDCQNQTGAPPAAGSAAGGGTAAQSTPSDAFEKCMNGRGWTYSSGW